MFLFLSLQSPFYCRVVLEISSPKLLTMKDKKTTQGLLDLLRQEIRVRHHIIRTEQAFVG